MRCNNCGYYWKDDDEAFPYCHYDDPWPAPCEQDEYYEEEEE